MGRWFWGHLERCVGNGRGISFWEGVWAGNAPLKRKFPRLFHLSELREESISEMGKWEDERWKWEWKWRRDLFDREKSAINEFECFINRFPLKENEEDTWRWTCSTNGAYQTKKAYELMSSPDTDQHGCTEETKQLRRIWNKLIPTKALAMTWRLILNQLPTRSNLANRNIIPQSGNQKCPLCDETMENASHIFLECNKSSDICYACYNWLGISYVHQNQISCHFEYNLGFFDGKLGGLLAIGMWICVVGTIWKNRNKLIFEDKRLEVESTIEEIKERLWSWILAISSSFRNVTFVEWLSNPRSILE